MEGQGIPPDLVVVITNVNVFSYDTVGLRFQPIKLQQADTLQYLLKVVLYWVLGSHVGLAPLKRLGIGKIRPLLISIYMKNKNMGRGPGGGGMNG